MCEFKVIGKSDGSHIMEDVVVLYYNENNELVLKDVIGMGKALKSALILDVNTINQNCVILENPVVKDFISLIVKINDNNARKSDVELIIKQLEMLKREMST
jgi:predicted RNA-binding protein